MKFTNYKKSSRIVSLALDLKTRDDLLRENIDFIFVSEDCTILYPDNEILTINPTSVETLMHNNNYDIFELSSDGKLKKYYDNTSIDNYFFVTGRCNSNCIMCPSSEYSRSNSDDANIDKLIEIARHIPISARHLTITGGEPFMAGENLFDFFLFLKQKFPATEFLLLTNGRIFAIKKYVQLLSETLPLRSIIGIPLHGSSPALHDAITCTENSFMQTICGIKNLLSMKFNVELRLVACSLNINDFYQIARLIVNEFPGILHVSIMAAEMTGSAYINRNSVWIPYSQAFNMISSSIRYLIEHEINVKLYNFPLCTVKKEFWTLCEKSISPNKIRYSEKCSSCVLKDACGGVFSGTYSLEKDDLKVLS